MYWERQRGDLCRLHSLNAFFGKNQLSETDFYNYCDEYDSIIEGLRSRNMDGFAEGRCIVNYIVELLTKNYTLTIPMDNFNNSREFIDINRYSQLLNRDIIDYFEFNKNHIWYNKRNQQDKHWYKIDSLSGVNRIDPSLRGNNGFILIFRGTNNILNQMNYFRKLLKNQDNFYKNEIYWCNLFHSSHNIKCYSKKFCFLKDELSKFIHLYRKNDIEKRNEQIKQLIVLLDIK